MQTDNDWLEAAVAKSESGKEDPDVPTVEDIEWTRDWAIRCEELAKKEKTPLSICMARAAKRVLISMLDDYVKSHSENGQE
jgi:hypothetical protein